MKRILVKRFLSLILSLCMILEGNLVGGMDVLAASVEPTENTTDSALVDSFEENSEDAFLAETAEEATLESKVSDEVAEQESEDMILETNSEEEVFNANSPEGKTEESLVELEEEIDLDSENEASPNAESLAEDGTSDEVVPYSTENSARAYTTSTTGNFSNLVIFVDFADTSHDHSNISTFNNNCHVNHPDKVFEFFDGSEAKPRGFRQYLYNISYGALQVMNIFPQYDASTGKFTPYKLKYNAEHYYSQNTDSEMIAEIIAQLNASGGVGVDLHLSKNENIVDNMTIVVACDDAEGNANKHFYGHKATYRGDEQVDGNLVRDYNLVTEGGVFMGSNQSGVLVHEFLHTLGYQDLYVNGGGATPVGMWDIMASADYRMKYPLAYFRSHYTKWFSIPEVTTSQKGYSIYAASAATAATKDRQAVILKTAYSDTEFFVLEYRRKGAYGSEDYDANVPGSGLIIYRINTNAYRNYDGAPWQAYVFRPGDSYAIGSDGKKYEQAQVNPLMNGSFFSAETNRTSYGTSDATKSLEDGAITYSDGMNSGIVIENIGSAAGDQITFDITFTDSSNGAYWTTVSSQDTQGASGIDSYMDSDGTIYYLQDRTNGIYLYRYQSTGWSQVGSGLSKESGAYGYQLVQYNGSPYIAYGVNNSAAKLYRWNGSGWEKVYATAGVANELDVTSDSSGIYLAYSNGDMGNGNSEVRVCKYAAGGGTELGVVAKSSQYACNPSIAVGDGRIVVLYKESFNNGMYVKQYNNGSWTLVGNQNLKANNGIIKLHKGKAYLLKNGESFGVNDSYLYMYDFASSSGNWTKAVEAAYANESIPEVDICFHGDAPHIVYLGGKSNQVYVKYIGDGGWEQLGTPVASEYVSGLRGYSYNGEIYLTYMANSVKKIYIKSHESQTTGGVGGGTTDPGGNTGGGTTDPGGNTGGGTTDPGGNTGGGTTDPGGNTGGGTTNPGGNTGGGTTNPGGNTGGGTTDPGGNTGGGTTDPGGNTGGGTTNPGGSTGEGTKPSTTKNGWVYENGQRYFYENGVKAASKEAFVDDYWRWFDADGTMAVSKDVYQRSNGGKWVRYDSSGRMIKGWNSTNQGSYYFDLTTGAMAKGVKEIGGKYYYFSKTTGIKAEFSSKEVPLDGDWYWFDADGTVAVSKDVYQWSSGGKWVRYDANGRMVKGWENTSRGTYYFDPITGAMAKGVKEIDGKFYYFYKVTGVKAEFSGQETFVDDYWRWFDADGTVAVSKDVYQWSSGGKWVRYDASGGMVKGWNHTFWGSYYFDLTTGAMAKGLSYIDGRWYYFDEGTGILRW